MYKEAPHHNKTGSYFIWSQTNKQPNVTNIHKQSAGLRHPVVWSGITARRSDSAFGAGNPRTLTPQPPERGQRRTRKGEQMWAKTTERETSYNKDQVFSNMWQPTSERLQVRVNKCPETEESERLSWKTRRTMRVERRSGSCCSCRCFVSPISGHGLYRQRLSVLNPLRVAITLRTALLLSFHRIANTHVAVCYTFTLQIPK